MALPIIYHSVEDVLRVLNDNKAKHEQAVIELLEIYDKTKKQFEENKTIEGKNYPFIVLEGLDGSGKSTVGFRLSKKLQAKAWRTPPNSITHLRPLFDGNAILRTAYYALGNYVAAMEVGIERKTGIVIMDRYWHSTCAYAVAQDVADNPEKKLPPAGDEIYSWPSDLIKPDMVLLLEVSEEIRRERHSKRNTTSTDQEKLLVKSDSFRNNVITVYKNITDPAVVPIDGNFWFNKLLPRIIKTINDVLKTDIETMGS